MVFLYALRRHKVRYAQCTLLSPFTSLDVILLARASSQVLESIGLFLSLLLRVNIIRLQFYSVATHSPSTLYTSTCVHSPSSPSHRKRKVATKKRETLDWLLGCSHQLFVSFFFFLFSFGTFSFHFFSALLSVFDKLEWCEQRRKMFIVKLCRIDLYIKVHVSHTEKSRFLCANECCAVCHIHNIW